MTNRFLPHALVLLSLTPAVALAQAAELPPETTPPPTVTESTPADVERPNESAVAETSTAAAVAPTESACAQTVYSSARASVVRVESGTRVGSGFLVVDGSHVITSFRLVRDGHDVRVVDPAGNARNASVINTAGDDDLAMLELTSPLPSAPLTIASWDSVHVGMPVVALAHSLVGGRHRLMGGPQTQGLFDWAIAAGVVSAVGDRSIQTDIELSDGSSGGPILDCAGHVVATVSVAFAGFDHPVFLGSGVPALADLSSRSANPEGYGGRVAFFFGLGISGAYETPGMLYGGYLQVGMTALDAFVLSGRFHYLMNSETPTGSATITASTDRLRGDAYAGWRQLVNFGGGMGFHFELGLGASVSSVHDTSRLATIEPMTTNIVIRSTEHQRLAVRPMAVLNLQFGPVVIGYSAEWDTTQMVLMHLLDLGFRF
jgi:hypothetical protein